jgi:hypothetical protein
MRFLFCSDQNSKILETLIDVDFNASGSKKGKLGKYIIDMPFSWIVWKIIEDIEQGNTNILSQLDDDTLQLMCLNIMP